jgi:hypothetical protein
MPQMPRVKKCHKDQEGKVPPAEECHKWGLLLRAPSESGIRKSLFILAIGRSSIRRIFSALPSVICGIFSLVAFVAFSGVAFSRRGILWCAVLGCAIVARGQGVAPEPAIPSGLIEPPRAVQPTRVVRPSPVPPPPPGQVPPTLTRYNGSYYVIPERSDSTILAIDAVLKRINWSARGRARNRLNSVNPPCTSVHIQIIDPRTVTVGTDQWPTWQHRLDGTPIRWRRNHQEQYDVSLRLSPHGVLEQRFVGVDGERINRYILSDGGKTLEMEVLVMSPKLPQPIHYTLRFART